jgi:hypothetical protein
MADINSQLPVKLTDGTLTATVRDAGSNDALNVAVVDASGNQVTSFGGGTQYTEDAASAGGESLTLAGAVRQDSIASSTSADGDYANLKVTSVGRLYTSATVDAALPAGTNAIGKLASNSGVDIGDVDVTSVIPGTGATNLGKAEDGASADGDTGIGMLAVRKATPANTSGADGDYEFLQMSAGRLWASATIDAALPAGTNAIGKLSANSGVDIGDVDVTSIIPGTAATNLGKAEDAAHSSGDTGIAAWAVRKDTAAALAGTDGDYAPLEVDATGNLYVKVNNAESSPLPVYITSGAASGSEVNSYDTVASVAASATSNHDYTVVNTTFLLKQITFAASGKMKVELKVGPVASLVSKGVWFTTSAGPSFSITLAQPIEVPVTATGTVRLVRTNLESSAMDVYSTMIGSDI